MGPGMLYMVGKIFPYGVMFDVAYKALSSEHMILFSQGSEKNITVFKTEMVVSKTAVCHPTHIYLSSTTLQNRIIG